MYNIYFIMYSTKMERYAWALQANVPAQTTLLEFSLLLALWQWTPTQTCHPTPCTHHWPPGTPCRAPLFYNFSGDVGGSHSSWHNEFHVVLSHIVPLHLDCCVLGDNPVDLTLPFTEPVNCCAIVVIVEL